MSSVCVVLKVKVLVRAFVFLVQVSDDVESEFHGDMLSVCFADSVFSTMHLYFIFVSSHSLARHRYTLTVVYAALADLFTAHLLSFILNLWLFPIGLMLVALDAESVLCQVCVFVWSMCGE
jgi:hypothetical protein